MIIDPAPAYIRQFKVDGEIFKKGAAEEKCDYLLLNDDAHKAYYIELKGSDIPIRTFRVRPQLGGVLRLREIRTSAHGPEVWCLHGQRIHLL